MSEISAADVLRIVLGSAQPHLVLCVSPFAAKCEVRKAASRMRRAARQTITNTPEVRARIDAAELKCLSYRKSGRKIAPLTLRAKLCRSNPHP